MILERVIKEKIACEPVVFLLNYKYKKDPFNFIPISDIKIKNSEQWQRVNPNNTEVFSTYNFSLNSKLDTLIQDLFPIKSKYEK